METTNIIKGLQIIEKSRPKQESEYHFRAEHDEVWVGSLEWEMSAEDKIELDKLGWVADVDADGWRARV